MGTVKGMPVALTVRKDDGSNKGREVVSFRLMAPVAETGRRLLPPSKQSWTLQLYKPVGGGKYERAGEPVSFENRDNSTIRSREVIEAVKAIGAEVWGKAEIEYSAAPSGKILEVPDLQ